MTDTDALARIIAREIVAAGATTEQGIADVIRRVLTSEREYMEMIRSGVLPSNDPQS